MLSKEQVVMGTVVDAVQIGQRGVAQRQRGGRSAQHQGFALLCDVNAHGMVGPASSVPSARGPCTARRKGGFEDVHPHRFGDHGSREIGSLVIVSDHGYAVVV